QGPVIFMSRVRISILLTAALATASLGAIPRQSAFPALVDEYLDQFARGHRSIAAGNGLHAHDGELEDFSAGAIAAEGKWLHEFRARLDAVDPGRLTPDERVDRRILLGI